METQNKAQKHVSRHFLTRADPPRNGPPRFQKTLKVNCLNEKKSIAQYIQQ